MNLAILVLLACCVVILPLFAQLKSWKTARLFAIVATVYAIFGAVGLFIIGFSSGEPLVGGSQFHDTYYIASGFHYYISIALFLLISTALLSFQQKLKVLLFPSTTRTLFWVINLGILTTNIAPQILLSLATPKQLAENSGLLNALNLISVWATLITLVAFLLMILLFFTSIILRRKKGG